MKTISAKVSNDYYDKIKEMADKHDEPVSQFVIDSCDRRLIELDEMEITRVFKPKIKMKDK